MNQTIVEQLITLTFYGCGGWEGNPWAESADTLRAMLARVSTITTPRATAAEVHAAWEEIVERRDALRTYGVEVQS